MQFKKTRWILHLNMTKNIFSIVHIVYLIEILFFLAKIFNIFTIVQFQNDDCISHTESPLVGTCYSSTGKYNSIFHYILHTLIEITNSIKSTSHCLRKNWYVQKMWGLRSQWNSAQMNHWHPYQSKNTRLTEMFEWSLYQECVVQKSDYDMRVI